MRRLIVGIALAAGLAMVVLGVSVGLTVLDVSLVSALDGEWGHGASIRGASARVTGSDWPEPGSLSVWWDGGGLGCTINGVTLSGPGVTEAELLATADALR